MTAPFSAYAATGVAVGYEPKCSGRIVSWDVVSTPAPVPLSILTAVVSEDEGRKPRVRVEATVARTPALDTLVLVEGWMLELTTGYRWVGAGGFSETFPTHAKLMLRELVPIIGTGTSELVAVGAESLLIDAHDDEQIYAAATFRQYFQALLEAVPEVIPWGSVFQSWWWNDPATSPGVVPPGLAIWNTSALLMVNKRESDLSNWADPLQASCEANNVEWFCTRLGVLTVRPIPGVAAANVFAFTDGPGGTITSFRPGASLEDFANDVWVQYAGNITARSRVKTTTARTITEVVDRTSIVATQAAANAAASSIRLRRDRYANTAELEAALVLWLKAGDRVTVSVEGGPAVPYVVQSIAYRFPRGDMSLTLRTN